MRYIILLLFFLAGCAPVKTYEQFQETELVEEYEVIQVGPPQRHGEWHTVPTVHICKNAPVTRSRVQLSLNYWKKLGYNFGEIYDNVDCPMMEDIMGKITISLPDNTFVGPNMALTRTLIVNDTREILAAKIYIHRMYATTERVMEHEVGHAIGWKHYNRKYHMMHPSWQYGGHNASGLKREAD